MRKQTVIATGASIVVALLWSSISVSPESQATAEGRAGGLQLVQSAPKDMLIGTPPFPDSVISLFDDPELSQKLVSSIQDPDHTEYTNEMEALVAMYPGNDDVALFVYSTLGTIWGGPFAASARVAGSIEDEIECAQKALGYLARAETIALSGKNPNKLVLAQIYHGLSEAFERVGNYKSALEINKKLASEYGGVGTGTYKNKLAASAVGKVVRYSIQLELDQKDVSTFLLDLASANVENDIGFAALMSLSHLQVHHGDHNTAAETTELLRERYGDAVSANGSPYAAAITELEALQGKLRQGGRPHP